MSLHYDRHHDHKAMADIHGMVISWQAAAACTHNARVNILSTLRAPLQQYLIAFVTNILCEQQS